MKPQPTMQKALKTHREIQLLFCEYMADINDYFESNNPVLTLQETVEYFFHEVQLLEKQYYHSKDKRISNETKP